MKGCADAGANRLLVAKVSISAMGGLTHPYALPRQSLAFRNKGESFLRIFICGYIAIYMPRICCGAKHIPKIIKRIIRRAIGMKRVQCALINRLTATTTDS